MKHIIIAILFFVSFCSCTLRTPSLAFNGEIIDVEDTLSPVYLLGEDVRLNEDIYAGYMSVYDSLLLFVSQRYANHYLYVFGINSGNLLGMFCPKGEGPGDFRDFYHSEQYVVENGDIKLWGYDCYHNIYLLNISQSIRKQTTDVDSLITQNWINYHTRPWSLFFHLSPDSLLFKSQPEYSAIVEDQFDFGSYFLYENSLKEEKIKYSLFNRLPKGQEENNVHGLYYSLDRSNGCGNKIAMAMRYFAQINILDTESGQLIGYRMKDTPAFDKINFADPRSFYTDICVDEQMIIALYANAGLDDSQSTNTVHVYNWDGNYTHKIILDRPVYRTAFDPVHKYLYGYTEDEKIVRYDLSDLSQ